ncbi:sca1 complex scaffold protein scaa [Anaeramoeba flamelloides]|uniref:Sca1 complex scaffold protein scaa n=1 Tax=Anaeramoeba flamelloides TaxID=1746091 RepID=A0ABQ8Z186_9EUKA|nr:sca1 complex scaffold protein scaa [Anaeramoeba flamelloides]
MITKTQKSNKLPFTKQFMGFRGSYDGPLVNPKTQIKTTKLENKYSENIPVFLDTQGNLYDLYYCPINQSQKLINYREEDLPNLEELSIVTNEESQKRGERTKIYSQITCKDPKEIHPFPDPENYETFEQFEQASLKWEEQIEQAFGLLQLPELVGGNFYRLKDTTKKKFFSDTDGRTETETDMVTENDLITENEGEIEEDEENEETEGTEVIPEMKLEDDKPILKKNEEFEIYKMLQNDKNEKMEIKNDEFSVDLKKVLLGSDPWDASLLPAEPKPNYYKTFGEYERACRRWSQIVVGQLKSMPMHARQLEKQALLKSYKKKIKKTKKKQFNDFVRNYSTWRENVIYNVESQQKHFFNKKDFSLTKPYPKNPLVGKLMNKQTISNDNYSVKKSQKLDISTFTIRKKNPTEGIWDLLNQETQNTIKSIFEKFYSKISTNEKLYDSSHPPLLGQFKPLKMRSNSQSSTTKSEKLSVFRYERIDIKKEIEQQRFICPNKIEDVKIMFEIPKYDLPKAIPFKNLKSRENYREYEEKIKYQDLSFRFKHFYSRHNYHCNPPSIFPEFKAYDKLITNLNLHYYLQVILIEYSDDINKSNDSLQILIRGQLNEISNKIITLLKKEPKILGKIIFKGIALRSSKVSLYFLFLLIRIFNINPEIILPDSIDELAIIDQFELLGLSKFIHSQCAAKLILQLFKKEEFIKKFAMGYSIDFDLLIGQLFAHSSMLEFVDIHQNNKVLQSGMMNEINSYLTKEKIFDEYEYENENESTSNNLKNKGLLREKNILRRPPSITILITNYFGVIYKQLPNNKKLIDLSESIILSEKLYNEIIAKLKKNIKKHSPSLVLIASFLSQMVKCLVKMNLIIGNHQIVSNNKKKRDKKERNDGHTSSKSMGGGSSGSGRRRRFRSLSLKKGQVKSPMIDKGKEIRDDLQNFLQNEDIKEKLKKSQIVIKQNKILQILNLINDAPEDAFGLKRFLIKILMYLLRVRSIFLEVYQNGLLFENLIKLCTQIKDFRLNKTSWKLFYQLIVYHSETIPFLIENQLMKQFVDLLTISSGIGVINQLYYLNKIFNMPQIEKKKFLNVDRYRYKRSYESHPIKSYIRDSKAISSFFESNLHYTRFIRLFKRYIITFAGAPFSNLAQIYYTIMDQKYCSKLKNEFKSSQEYKEALNWFAQNRVFSDQSNDKNGKKIKKRQKSLFKF